MSASTPDPRYDMRINEKRNAKFKLLIAGSRSVTALCKLYHALNMSGILPEDVSEIVSGGAKGVDTLAETVAKNLNIPTKIFPANWDAHGREAGFIRNVEMAKYADELLALWDGESRGTAHMVKTMKDMGKRVHLLTIDAQGEVLWVE